MARHVTTTANIWGFILFFSNESQIYSNIHWDSINEKAFAKPANGVQLKLILRTYIKVHPENLTNIN
jgi:hypothetical protein